MQDMVLFRLEITKQHSDQLYLLIGIFSLIIMVYFFSVLKRWRRDQVEAIERTVTQTEVAIKDFKKQTSKLEREVKDRDKATVETIQDFNLTHTQLKKDIALLKKVLQQMGVKNPNAPEFDPSKDIFSGE